MEASTAAERRCCRYDHRKKMLEEINQAGYLPHTLVGQPVKTLNGCWLHTATMTESNNNTNIGRNI